MLAIAKTPAVLSSEILLKSSGYVGWFILLEGDFDQRFWASRLNASHLRPINCVGKPNVLGALDLLTSRHQAQKIVALADKDYDEILSRLRQFPQLIYTDENDLEVTLLRCPSRAVEPAMERILSESIDVGKRQSFEAGIGYSAVEHLRQMAANYGVLRLINEQLQSEVDLNSLSILHSNFLDHAVLKQDQTELQIAFVNAVNKVGKVQLTVAELEAKIELHRIGGLFSGWKLVQGHDLMQLLAIAINSKALRHEAGHRQVSDDSLARDLCLMIHRHDLQTTAMFQALSERGNVAGLVFVK
jgi:hypothetical protein